MLSCTLSAQDYAAILKRGEYILQYPSVLLSGLFIRKASLRQFFFLLQVYYMCIQLFTEMGLKIK